MVRIIFIECYGNHRDRRVLTHSIPTRSSYDLRIALEDPYFVERKLYPNVDFYSGIVQRAIGIPTSLFTAIFALARTVGWIAQWSEMLSDPNYKIGRPRQLYIEIGRANV